MLLHSLSSSSRHRDGFLVSKSVMECLGGVDVLTYRDTVNLKAHKRADPVEKKFDLGTYISQRDQRV